MVYGLTDCPIYICKATFIKLHVVPVVQPYTAYVW